MKRLIRIIVLCAYGLVWTRLLIFGTHYETVADYALNTVLPLCVGFLVYYFIEFMFMVRDKQEHPRVTFFMTCVTCIIGWIVGQALRIPQSKVWTKYDTVYYPDERFIRKTMVAMIVIMMFLIVTYIITYKTISKPEYSVTKSLDFMLRTLIPSLLVCVLVFIYYMGYINTRGLNSPGIEEHAYFEFFPEAMSLFIILVYEIFVLTISKKSRPILVSIILIALVLMASQKSPMVRYGSHEIGISRVEYFKNERIVYTHSIMFIVSTINIALLLIWFRFNERIKKHSLE